MDKVFDVTGVIGNQGITVTVKKRMLDTFTWYEVQYGQWVTCISKRSDGWQMTGPKSELTIDDIQALGDLIDAGPYRPTY